MFTRLPYLLVSVYAFLFKYYTTGSVVVVKHIICKQTHLLFSLIFNLRLMSSITPCLLENDIQAIECPIETNIGIVGISYIYYMYILQIHNDTLI